MHLNFFNKSIFSGLGLNNTGKPEVKTKDVDFCIGKETTAEFESLQSKFIIPLVAVECKTYVDKTMFGEAQFTAQLIKNGTPDARVYILAERNEIGKGKIPTLTPLDQYFTLKKNEKSPIVPEVVIDFFSEVQKVLSNATTHRVRDPPGRMIPK